MKFHQRWRAYQERLRFKYLPPIANWLLHASTFRSRKKILETGRLRILVDNTVIFHAITHETAWVSTGPSTWGPHTLDTGYTARVPVHAPNSKTREYGNVLYLAGLAHLCRQGYIELVTSAELKDEQFRQPMGRYRGYSYFDYSIFGGVDIPSVDGWLMPSIGPSWAKLPSAKEQQRTRLNQQMDDPIYAGLVKILGRKNSQDAWHLYTAEKYGSFCYLTMDFRFVRSVAAQAKSEPLASLRTVVMTPKELGAFLGLLPFPPNLLSYNGADFFVRSDLSMPEAKRRPKKDYSS